MADHHMPEPAIPQSTIGTGATRAIRMAWQVLRERGLSEQEIMDTLRNPPIPCPKPRRSPSSRTEAQRGLAIPSDV
jgi:hypothetical protein